MVTNEREFTAVISEIDYATKAIEEATSVDEELERRHRADQSEIAERRKAQPEEEAAQREVVEAWEQRKAELLKMVHDLVAEAKEDRNRRFNPQTRARFLRLLESKQGNAMSEVVDGSCSLCHFALRPHLQQRVRRCEEIIDCEHCHRILYVEDMLDRLECRTGRRLITDVRDSATALAAVRRRVEEAADRERRATRLDHA